MNFGITPCPLTQIETLTTNGVDISDPSKLSDGQWGLVCSQTRGIDSSSMSMIKPCSSKLAKLFDASESKCKNQDSQGNEADQKNQQAHMQDAMCSSVGVLVRLRVDMRTKNVFANCKTVLVHMTHAQIGNKCNSGWRGFV